jgi:hypothetical protein
LHANASRITILTLLPDFPYSADERRRFAASTHEYLISQVQFSGSETVAPKVDAVSSTSIRLAYNHPCKYIVAVLKDPSVSGIFTAHPTATDGLPAPVGGVISVPTNEALAPIASLRLQLNGHDRQSTRSGAFYSIVSPLQFLKSSPQAGIYLMSFSLKPDEDQPSGSVNLSRIDNVTLSLSLKAAKTAVTAANLVMSDNDTTLDATKLTELDVFAVNYNVLRIMSGMGGLAYAS